MLFHCTMATLLRATITQKGKHTLHSEKRLMTPFYPGQPAVEHIFHWLWCLNLHIAGPLVERPKWLVEKKTGGSLQVHQWRLDSQGWRRAKLSRTETESVHDIPKQWYWHHSHQHAFSCIIHASGFDVVYLSLLPKDSNYSKFQNEEHFYPPPDSLFLLHEVHIARGQGDPNSTPETDWFCWELQNNLSKSIK